METMEFEGKTTEEAIENASKYLELPVEELDIDIIEPGSAGIFGLVGTKKAKIKVRYPAADESLDLDAAVPESLMESQKAETSRSASNDSRDLSAANTRSSGFLRDRQSFSVPETSADETRPAEPSSEPQPVEGPEQAQELRLAKDVLENILELLPMETTVDAGRIDGNIHLNIQGDNSGLLIGRRGKTLDALQFIVNKIVNKSLERKVRVVVDSEKYRQRRRDSLTQLALRMGEKAKRIRKPVTTNPMNPGDRRIVHLALKDDGELDTRSRGEGLMKKVVIIPRK